MTDPSKIKPSHIQRAAYVYIRQSTPGQVEHNRESTARQYALADKARHLGWPQEQVVIVDEDLGLSGSGTDKRSGFARLTSEVALAHVGIVLGLEVSRLARNNADWYRLLELCGVTDTLIGDNDGVYHPALFNDRLLLGLKGTMSEAELHIIRARLDGGTYTALHHILTNPVYAGAYTYGKTKYERYIDEHGAVRKRTRHLPMDQWAVLIADHHPGYIDWATFEANQARLDSNTRPRPHESGGAVREGAALLQGLATCGHCGRRLHVHYRGRNSAPGYHCCGKDLVNGRGVYCLNVGGTVIEPAVANAFLEAITPAAIDATCLSVEQLKSNHDASVSQWRLEVERTCFEAERAERRYRSVDPENRLVARGLEAEWETCLRAVAEAEAELHKREQQRPASLEAAQLEALLRLGSDLGNVWNATTTTDRDRKELLRTLLEEVVLNLKRAEGRAHLTLRWRGGAITTLDVPVPRFRPIGPRTDEDTISLLRRLAALYPDEVIAGIFNRQGRQTATGERFTANQVGSLRRYRNIPRFQPSATPTNGELVTIRKAAQILGMNTSSIHRWLADGFIAGEQATPGAPWQIRITDELSARIVGQSPPEYLPMLEATLKLGVSRQTVLQRVKRGELEAVLVRQGRRKGLRIKIVEQQPSLFSNPGAV
jgi:DNA invertase Pin-like site-specific DNA recombinase/predicted DNA-binding transcriptional regulator AlpA